MELEVTDRVRLREALTLSLHALDAAQKSGAIGTVWNRDTEAIREIRSQLGEAA